ncbi:MAG: phenylalanine--tRNA ligase subunit alpha, partial [Acetivibrio sp.]
MQDKLKNIVEQAVSQIKEADGMDKLNDIRVAFLGKKGELTSVLKSMK